MRAASDRGGGVFVRLPVLSGRRACARTFGVRWLVLAIVIGTASSAAAHQSSVKYVDITVDGAHARVKLTVAPSDVTEPLGLSADARPSASDASTPAVAAFVAHWLAIEGCTAAAPSAGPDPDRRFIVVTWDVTCPERIDRRALALDFTPFFAVDQRHEAILTVHVPGEDVEPHVVRESEPHVTVRAGEAGSVVDWIGYGMDHIYSGRDHICFVISLLLVVVLTRARDGGGWRTRSPLAALRATAAIVTAFTVAHSLSLIAAALGWIALPSRLVESLIALSIAYTAIEDVIKPDVRWRFVLTFGFGLVHGLGFASVLEETLPKAHVIVPLLSFNVGVELGQLTVVAVALPVCWLACRARGPEFYRRIVLPLAAAPLVVVAVYWLVHRITM